MEISDKSKLDANLLAKLKSHTYEIVGCCQEVHRELGPWLNEYVYQEALKVSLEDLNARSLEKRGLCHVLLQENMTEQSLADAVRATWNDREQLIHALREAPPADGTNRVLEMIEEIQQ